MKIILSKDEMLERFRLARGLEPLRSDCAVEVTDGVDLDGMLAEQLRRRYAELLSSGRPELLVSEDVAGALSEVNALREGLGEVVMSDACARVLEIRLDGWTRPATVEPPEALGALMMSLDNVYTRCAPEYPRAVQGPDGRRIYVHPLMTRRVVSARGVLDPGPERFVVQEAALSELFDKIKIELP